MWRLQLPFLDGIPNDDTQQQAKVQDEEKLNELVSSNAPSERLILFMYFEAE